MTSNGNEQGDVDVEAQWCEEISSLFEVAAARYRRFAGLLRIAAGALREIEFEAERVELRRINYRLAHVLRADYERHGGSVEP